MAYRNPPSQRELMDMLAKANEEKKTSVEIIKRLEEALDAKLFTRPRKAKTETYVDEWTGESYEGPEWVKISRPEPQYRTPAEYNTSPKVAPFDAFIICVLAFLGGLCLALWLF